MNNPKAQKILNILLKEATGEWNPESVCEQLTQLRTIALEMNDPLIVKTLRLMREKIQEDDNIDIVGLTEFAPGKPLTLVLNHADGSKDEISVNHTYNDQQIEWFKAGAALNIIRKQFGA